MPCNCRLAGARPLTSIDHLAIEGGATSAALMLLHQETVSGAGQSLRDSFPVRLIEGKRDRLDLQLALRQLRLFA